MPPKLPFKEPWSEAEVERLVRLWTLGEVRSTILVAFRPARSLKQVDAKIVSMLEAGQLQVRPLKLFDRQPWLPDLVRKAVEGGVSMDRMASIFRRSPDTIKAWLNELGLEYQPREPAPVMDQRRCLGGCGQMRPSANAGDRVCEACKREGGFASMPYSDVVVSAGY